MTIGKRIFYFGVCSFLSNWALAQSTTSVGDLTKILGQKKFADDLQITDPKLKAESGSLSRYSLKFNLTYEGPMIGDLGAQDRPNPDGKVETTATTVNGAMLFRYRLNPRSALNFGTGVNGRYPTQGFSQFDLRTPQASYDIVSTTQYLQMRNSFGTTVTTIPELQRVGQVAGLNTSFSMVHDMGQSHFAVGMDSFANYFFYDRDYKAGARRSVRHNHVRVASNGINPVVGDGNAQTFEFAVIPNIKYLFNDHLDVATSLNFGFWDPRSTDNPTRLKNKTVSERLSLDYGYSRDFYISPYIGFYPGSFALSTTTINISGIFSLM